MVVTAQFYDLTVPVTIISVPSTVPHALRTPDMVDLIMSVHAHRGGVSSQAEDAVRQIVPALLVRLEAIHSATLGFRPFVVAEGPLKEVLEQKPPPLERVLIVPGTPNLLLQTGQPSVERASYVQFNLQSIVIGNVQTQLILKERQQIISRALREGTEVQVFAALEHRG